MLAKSKGDIQQYVFDIECNGFNPDKIHVLSAQFKGQSKHMTNYDSMRELVSKADALIGHNIIRFDVPILERLLGVKVEAKLVDTLALSWYLYPDRNRHGLADWGVEFGVPKPVITDWDNQPIETYIHRCNEDVRINTLLWNQMWDHLMRIYNSEEGAWLLIDYLSFKMDCAREAEKSRWKLDPIKAKTLFDTLNLEHTRLTDLLRDVMPMVAKTKVSSRPVKPYKKDGNLKVIGERWFALTEEKGLPFNFEGTITTIKEMVPANPNSHDQIKAWLYDLGWVPISFKHVRDKETNEFRQIPQVRIDDDGVKVLCPSVLRLNHEGIEHLKTITVVAHRKSIAAGFLEAMEDGYVTARIQGLTNTLRFKHSELVNLPGVNKAYGTEVRGCLIAPEGYELCGADMVALEDITKQHYMYPYDPDYVNEMNTEDFDPHLDIALLAGMMTEEEVATFKGGDKSLNHIRHSAKQVNYSCTYGISAKGIVRNTGMRLGQATKLRETFWKRNWAVEAIAKDVKTKTVDGQMWLFNPVSNLWYSLRYDKDKFSTLNQGTGAYCFDMWVKRFRFYRPEITGQFHDEVILCVKKGNRDKAIELLKVSIREINQDLKLNRNLDVSVQFGDSYADIH